MTAALRLVAAHGQQITETPKASKMDGFIQIPNAVEDALLLSPLTRRQERVYRAILRKTLGYGKTSDFIATSQLADMTGVDESDVRQALRDLQDMGMIVRGRRKTVGTYTEPVLSVESWTYCVNGANHPEQVKSPRKAPQTGRITPSIRGESPPTKDNSKRQGKEANASSSACMQSDRLAECPHAELIELYHAILPECPEVQIWNDTRKKLMRSRWNEQAKAGRYKTKAEGLDFWKRYFGFVAKSKFLTGKTDPANGRPPFIADMEWLIKPTNFAKVVEGKYHRDQQEDV